MSVCVGGGGRVTRGVFLFVVLLTEGLAYEAQRC